MKSSRFFAIYLCYVLLQVLLCNYLNLTYYLTLSILPVLVLLIPVRYSTITAMLIAAASGFLVDFLGDGVLEFSTYIIIAQALFLIIYIAADGAGTRPFWFNALRFAISLPAGTLLSLFIADTLTKDYRDR